MGSEYGSETVTRALEANSNQDSEAPDMGARPDAIIKRIRDKIKARSPGLSGEDLESAVLREAQRILRRAETKARSNKKDKENESARQNFEQPAPRPDVTGFHSPVSSKGSFTAGNNRRAAGARHTENQDPANNLTVTSQMPGPRSSSQRTRPSSLTENSTPHHNRTTRDARAIENLPRPSDPATAVRVPRKARTTMSANLNYHHDPWYGGDGDPPSFEPRDRYVEESSESDHDGPPSDNRSEFSSKSFIRPRPPPQNVGARASLTAAHLAAAGVEPPSDANVKSRIGRGGRQNPWTGASASRPEQIRPPTTRGTHKSGAPSSSNVSSSSTFAFRDSYQSSGDTISHFVNNAAARARIPRAPASEVPEIRGKQYGESSDEEDDAASDEHIKLDPDRPAWTGDAALLINKFKCHFPGCPNGNPARGFKTIGELKRHKRFMHDICEKCKMEFENFEALLAHKQMSANHIACWTCGKDFHTAPARERHMLASHPELKNLECPGCGKKHNDSASFVGHIERNDCQGIGAEQFDKARIMLTKVMEFAVVEQTESSDVPKGPKKPPGLDMDNEEDFPGLPGLDLRKKEPPHILAARKKKYEEPHKPPPSKAGATGDLIKKLETMSTAGPLPNVDIDPTQQRLIEVYKKMVGTDHGVYDPPFDADGNVVFEGIPDHEYYNPAAFKNKFGNYICPHPFCTKPWKNEIALDNHLKGNVHRRRDLRCPECCNIFNSAEAITAHFESPTIRCKIRTSPIFREAMEIASGSFLTASHDTYGKSKVDTQEPDW